MKIIARLAATVAALGLALPALAQQPVPVTVIHAGTLLAEPGKAPLRNASVIIRGGKIEAVQPGFADVPGARLVDLRNATVLPGLIDMHVHLIGLDDRFQARLQRVNREDADEAFTGLVNARKMLLAGFTTVRDLGAEPRLIIPLRNALASGEFAGPTIVSAGRMVSVSGGHGDARNGLNRDVAATVRINNVCNGPEDCGRAVREQVSGGADLIKIAATGGVLSNVAGGLNQQMTEEEMRAVVRTAHMFGRKVAAHAHGVDGINAALRAGVDSVEHGTFTNDETFRLYKQGGAYYVPTLLAPAAALADGRRGALTPAQYEKAQQAAGNAKTSLARAVREGVKIAFGTDTGVSKHGDNAQEFALMVEAGMSPEAAIRSATVGAADLLGRSDRIGTIAAGKDADIIAVEGDPLSNVRLLESVGFVMRQGRVYKLAGRPQLGD
ncbi:MAG: amidohydrolase family protein [Pseudomonadota bacterium]|nr:amidohydrolase family protein [Pseudomonadota bacterium]